MKWYVLQVMTGSERDVCTALRRKGVQALCLGHRVQPLLDDGCTANGIDANLRLLGPEALADYDVIVCAVDNNAAKVLLNELVRRLPEERRPVVIMDGTHGEMAQSVMLDNRDFCLRCLMDESWMKDDASAEPED